jgi:sugar phosphate isomerase/epimerase
MNTARTTLSAGFVHHLTRSMPAPPLASLRRNRAIRNRSVATVQCRSLRNRVYSPSMRYRLGTTSWIYPDRLLPNVRRLASRVDDIELLLFDVSSPADLPDSAEMDELARIKRDAALTFSLHTPLAASLASEDDARRREGVRQVCAAIDLARPLEPERTIVHVYYGEGERGPRPTELDAWRGRARASLESILASGMAPRDLCVEWLDYDLGLLQPVIDDLGLSVVIDVGHLHRDGIDLGPVLEAHLNRTRVIHWHGTDPRGRDHRGLDHYPEASARRLLRALDAARWDGVLTLEVFREADFERSMNILRAIMDSPES